MSKSLTLWLAASAALGAVAMSAGAQEPAKTTGAQSPGMVVVRDAATGQLRAPTADEAKTLQRKSQQSTTGRKRALAATEPTEEPLATGGYKLVVDESFDSYSVATRRPDGSIALDCVTGADTAKKIVSGKRGVKVSNKEAGHAHQ